MITLKASGIFQTCMEMITEINVKKKHQNYYKNIYLFFKDTNIKKKHIRIVTNSFIYLFILKTQTLSINIIIEGHSRIENKQNV